MHSIIKRLTSRWKRRGQPARYHNLRLSCRYLYAKTPETAVALNQCSPSTALKRCITIRRYKAELMQAQIVGERNRILEMYRQLPTVANTRCCSFYSSDLPSSLCRFSSAAFSLGIQYVSTRSFTKQLYSYPSSLCPLSVSSFPFGQAKPT